jgi:hypothetical protein
MSTQLPEATSRDHGPGVGTGDTRGDLGNRI